MHHFLAHGLLSGQRRELHLLQRFVGICQQSVEDSCPRAHNGQSVVNTLWRTVQEEGKARAS